MLLAISLIGESYEFFKTEDRKGRKDKYWSTKHYTRKPKIDPDEFHQLKLRMNSCAMKG